MKIEPMNDWMSAKACILKPSENLIVPGAEKNITRFFVIEEVSVSAAQAGYKPGDIVIAAKVWDVKLTHSYVRHVFPAADVLCRVRDIELSAFVDLEGNPVQEAAAAA